MTGQLVSPHYTHKKLRAPTYVDLLDVFEDRMRYWLLEPAEQLLGSPHGVVAAFRLSLDYFEGIEIYYSGQDSKGRSKEFFRRGFKRVFDVDPDGAQVFDEITNAIYVQARCGFAHDGLFRNRVFFNDSQSEPLKVTWPRKHGGYVKDGHLESVTVNPARVCESVGIHFSRYISILRAETDATLKANFQVAVALKWGLNEPPPIIGMPEY